MARTPWAIAKPRAVQLQGARESRRFDLLK